VTTYFDSSALVAIYVTETFSARARSEAQAVPQIPFTALHDLEVRNALRLIHGRRLITASELRTLFAHLDQDIEARRLAEVRLDLFRIFERAGELSLAHAARLLCRSLDILHVASALELHCTQLVSGDDRQLALGKLVGLRPIDIKKRHAGAPTARRRASKRPRPPE
jgi:predicted nucleic acid-binding protein